MVERELQVAVKLFLGEELSDTEVNKTDDSCF